MAMALCAAALSLSMMGRGVPAGAIPLRQQRNATRKELGEGIDEVDGEWRIVSKVFGWVLIEDAAGAHAAPSAQAAE